MRRLTVFVEPALAHAGGAQLEWTLANLLVGMGFAWQTVGAPSETCDIAYVTDAASSKARITLRAASAGWRHFESERLAGLESWDDAVWPRFASTPCGPAFDLDDGRLVVHHDILRSMFFFLDGSSEPSQPYDRHGRRSLEHDDVGRTALRHAVASGLGAWLQQWVEALTGVDSVPRWPNGKRAAVCLSHDVDYPEAVRWIEPMRVVARRGLAGVRPALEVVSGRRHHWHFQSWMMLERMAGARSAFYFSPTQGSLLRRARGTPDVLYNVRAQRFRALIGELVDQGFEVGLHASYRACERAGGIASEREGLESATGIEIAGGRHHYWRLLPECPAATLREHEDAGLGYDCSLFHDRYVGWRRGSAWPFFPFDHERQRALRTLQIPTGWMDDQFFGMKQDNPGDADAIIEGLVDTALEQQGCFAVDIHEYVFDDELYPGWAGLYRRFVERLVARSDVWVATPAELAGHWRQRAEGLSVPRNRPVTAPVAVVQTV